VDGRTAVPATNEAPAVAVPVDGLPAPADAPATKKEGGEPEATLPKRVQTEHEKQVEASLSEIDADVVAEMAKLPPPGCPDVHVDLSNGRIDILKPITFENGKAKLTGTSFNILGQVATTLSIVERVGTKHKLPLAKFLVEGHTNCSDPQNRKSKYHMTLSGDRAKACKTFLVKRKGTNKKMLTAKGFGGVQRIFEAERGEDITLNQRVVFSLANADDLAGGAVIVNEGVTGHTR